MSHPQPIFDRIRLQMMWNRLIAVAEEQAQSLLRTAFGAVAREAGDLSAGVYDTRGRMLAQAVTGTPGHVNTMATAVKHFLDRFSVTSMHDGDAYITNDPWYGTGHLFDYVVVTPVWRSGSVVALFASTCHTLDVGGVGFSAEAESCYAEGTCIPHLKLRSEGRLNEDILSIITTNSRNPVEARGDILSLLSSNDVGAQRLRDMMDELDIESIQPLADHIIQHSYNATRAAITRLPDGIYTNSMTIDGYEAPIHLFAKVTIDGSDLTIDYSGTSQASKYGINSPKCYTDAYTVYGIKCLITADIPNNAGSLAPFHILAPAGLVVNATRPSPVTARHVVGQMLPDLMFGALAPALDLQVPAESFGSIWVLALANDFGITTHEEFNIMGVGLGGMGARPTRDGLSTTAFPSGVGGIPLEVLEGSSPLIFWVKEFIIDSGGAGCYRGGLGQRIVIRHRDDAGFRCNAATFDRLLFPARGRNGGTAGRAGKVFIETSAGRSEFIGKDTIHVPSGGTLILELPGGGGFGDPRSREPDSIRRDLIAEFISQDQAVALYGFDSMAQPLRDPGLV